MKKLFVNNEVFEADKIIKSENSIMGYTNGIEVFSFKGITDFSIFQLGEGFDELISVEDRLKSLEKDMADLMKEIALGGM